MSLDFIARSQAKALGPGAFLCPEGSVTDPELAALAVGYKRTSARYRAMVAEEIPELPHGELWTSPKIDGHLWIAVIEDGEVCLISHRNRVIYGDLPLIQEIKERIAPKCSGRTLLAGELFALRREGRPRSGDVGSALAGGEAAQVSRLGFYIFDLYRGGDAEEPLAAGEYVARWPVLARLVGQGKRAQLIPTERLSGPDAVAKMFQEKVIDGKAEGLVVRTADQRTYKVKPAFDLDAVVIGFTEREGDDGQMLVRSVLLACMRTDRQLQIIGSCGNFGGDAERAAFYQELSPKVASTAYRYPSSSGALYRFVQPEQVIQVRVTDIQSEDGGGQPIQRMVISFDAESGWSAIRPMPGVSILHPVFQKRRPDKVVDAHDIRLAQVLERVELSESAAVAQVLDLPESSIVRREVWTKTTKGSLGVRKLVVWKTNKEEMDPGFSAFVVHWTDYSAGRKDPLKREVKLAPTRVLADALAEGLIVKNIKKGWEAAP
ncbi:MAG: hypothetical protein ACI9VR_002214 [Cognaticolwellia sp.]|jgi:hypothetical protein